MKSATTDGRPSRPETRRDPPRAAHFGADFLCVLFFHSQISFRFSPPTAVQVPPAEILIRLDQQHGNHSQDGARPGVDRADAGGPDRRIRPHR